MIIYAQNNERLIEKKEELQKKKNGLRIQIQRQLASLNELKNKVGPLEQPESYYRTNLPSPGISHRNSVMTRLEGGRLKNQND